MNTINGICRNCGVGARDHDDEKCRNMWQPKKEGVVARMIGNGKGESCGTCRFFFGDTTGECHRNPPAAVEGWPAVGKSHWCGEYKKEPEDDNLVE